MRRTSRNDFIEGRIWPLQDISVCPYFVWDIIRDRSATRYSQQLLSVQVLYLGVPALNTNLPLILDEGLASHRFSSYIY